MNTAIVTQYDVSPHSSDVTLHPFGVTFDPSVSAPAMIVHVRAQFAHSLDNMTSGTAVYSYDDPLYEDRYEKLYLRLQNVTGLVFYPFFCVFGLTGNILSLCVLSHRKMRSSTNTYLQTLAVSDCIKLLNDLAYFFTILFLNIYPEIGNKMFGYLYPYAHYFFNMSVCITAWITVSVAAERYILVCHAASAKQICNIHRARVISVFVFVSMTILTLPLAFRYRTITANKTESNETYLDVEVTELWQNKTFAHVYTWIQNLLRAAIPLVILCTLNAFIISALRRTKAKRMSAGRRRISMMLVAVIIVFLVCMTPDCVMSTILGYGYYEADYLVRAVREVTDLLLLVNSAVNFLLYCIFNSIFRKRAIHMFCHCTNWAKELFRERENNMSRHTSLGSNFKDTVLRQTILSKKDVNSIPLVSGPRLPLLVMGPKLSPVVSSVKLPPLCYHEDLTENSGEMSHSDTAV